MFFSSCLYQEHPSSGLHPDFLSQLEKDQPNMTTFQATLGVFQRTRMIFSGKLKGLLRVLYKRSGVWKCRCIRRLQSDDIFVLGVFNIFLLFFSDDRGHRETKSKIVFVSNFLKFKLLWICSRRKKAVWKIAYCPHSDASEALTSSGSLGYIPLPVNALFINIMLVQLKHV